MHTLTAVSCLREGWKIFKKRPFLFVGATAVLIVASMIVRFIASGGSFSNDAPLGILGFVVVAAGDLLADIGKTSFNLRAYDDTTHASLRDLWHPEGFFNYAVALILTYSLVVLGFIMLIIPGIILMLMLAFVKLAVVDKGVGPIKAMEVSADMTKGYRLFILKLLLASLVLNLLGLVCALVGILVTAPVTALALVHAYRTLEGGGHHAHHRAA